MKLTLKQKQRIVWLFKRDESPFDIPALIPKFPYVGYHSDAAEVIDVIRDHLNGKFTLPTKAKGG